MKPYERKCLAVQLLTCAMVAEVLVPLKLMGSIDWSWWWVLVSLWLPATVVFVLGFVGMVVEITLVVNRKLGT